MSLRSYHGAPMQGPSAAIPDSLQTIHICCWDECLLCCKRGSAYSIVVALSPPLITGPGPGGSHQA
jgi:hypothetical protein